MQHWPCAASLHIAPYPPQVAASVRVDNRGGPKASLTLKLADSTVDTSTASVTAGTTLVKEASVTVTLAVSTGAGGLTASCAVILSCCWERPPAARSLHRPERWTRNS